MENIEYVDFQYLDRIEILNILNKQKVRDHLVTHEEFDATLLDEWIKGKVKVNQTYGCKVKGIKVDGAAAGWCGIQFENGSYELAIVLDPKYWGVGLGVFKEMMRWASELDHSKVVVHLFNTRPEYRFLRKMADRVYESTMFGQKYTSYELKVPGA